MILRPLGSLTLVSLLSFSHIAWAEENNEPEKLIPADLIDDPHVREELGVNEFTAPSIRLIFDDLEQLAPLPVEETQHPKRSRMPLVRSDLALEIGVLIAEGFLAVQNNTLNDIEEVAKELSRYGKALGAGERVNRHAASLLDHAANNRSEELRAELAATQKDVEIELVQLRDADLAHLISLGGWARALECASLAVDRNFTEERANQLFREDVADYYESVVGSLDPQVSELPHMVKIQQICADLRDTMTLAADEEPTEGKVSKIRILSAELTKLALSRGK
ncbi:hypothetical protein [Rubritalea marina]|uniref:hypothetical protein n=1 Tax=Rubritalea marina TaxID=361055 RepID=UPI00035C3045|nr:hypothetical protein [Rubritalea marina]